MKFSRDMVLREKRGRVKDAYRNIAAVSLLIIALCGCETPEYLCTPEECPQEIKAEARAVNAIRQQRREGR